MVRVTKMMGNYEAVTQPNVPFVFVTQTCQDTGICDTVPFVQQSWLHRNHWPLVWEFHDLTSAHHSVALGLMAMPTLSLPLYQEPSFMWFSLRRGRQTLTFYRTISRTRTPLSDSR